MTETTFLPAAALAAARDAVVEAGRIALGHFRPGARTTADIHWKHGGSPVTDADLAVDVFLRARLTAAAPGFGWLSEETADTEARLSRSRIWVVDPIDGTRAFARGDTDWTIAVGIVEEGHPVAGFVFAPVKEEFYEALPGSPATLNGRAIAVTRRTELAGARVAGPRPALDALAAREQSIEMAGKIHSLAYRIVRVAEGTLDGGLAGGNAHDWDLAAAHAILEAAGGRLVGASGATPRYNRPSTVHEPLAAAGPGLVESLVEALAPAEPRGRRRPG